MKQILFLLIAMSLTAISFSQQRDTVKTKDGRTIIININPDKPNPTPPRNQQQKPQTPIAKEPFVIDLTINHEQQAPVFIPDNKGNSNGLVTWLWILSALFFALISILVTWWILARRRVRYNFGYDGYGFMLHGGDVDHDGHMQHNGTVEHLGVVRHEHFQMPAEEKKS